MFNIPASLSSFKKAPDPGKRLFKTKLIALTSNSTSPPALALALEG